MAQIMFGSGSLVLKTADGEAHQIGVLKDVSLDIASSTKELRGNTVFPIAVVTTAMKVTGKAKFAQINGRLMQAVLGGTVTSGSVKSASETSAPVANTITVTHSADFVSDLGVMDQNGQPMDLVASAPAAGQYSVAAGVYTFNAAQTAAVTISYSYTSTAGTTLKVSNTVMGQSTKFQALIFNTFDGKSFGLKCHAVVVPKLSYGFKGEDFTEQDLDFECFADAAGDVVTQYEG